MHWPKKVLSVLIVAFLPYSWWIYTNATRNIKHSAALSESSVSNGRKIWQKNNCFSCHQIYGLGGYLGPELTKVISQKGVPYTRAFIQNGGLIMPKFNFSEPEVSDLIAYLTNIDSSASTYNKRPKFVLGNTITESE